MLPSIVLAAALTVDAHRWRDRLLVVFAPARSPALIEQRRRIDPAAFAERDLQVITVVGDAVAGAADAAKALRHRFGVGRADFRVVLVGKDGHVARTSATPLTATDLSATIDAMPMRRDELRRR